jgi:hypothetical protein
MAMSERVLARIWLGGELRRSESYRLVMVVCKAQVSVGSPGWEHLICKPMSIDGLMEATTEGVLHLQDDAAPDGEMPLLTRTCRRLGLTYRLWHEPTLEDGCCVEVWEPGMEEPIRLRGDPCDPITHLVESVPIRLAINHLRNGEIAAAIDLLRRACPDIHEVPPLVVIDD